MFEEFRKLTKTEVASQKDKQRHALFAIKPSGHCDGWVNFHLLLWKHVIFSLVQVDTEDEPFAPHKIWGVAWIRFEKKTLALQERAKQVLRRAASRGNEPPDVSARGRPMHPIAKLSVTGEIEWNDGLVEAIKKLGEKPEL